MSRCRPAETPELYADFLDELTSDYQDDRGRWKRRGPNEYGDCLRIGRVLAELQTRGGKLWGRLEKARPARQQPHTPQSTGNRFSLLGGGRRPSLTPR